MKLNCHNIFLSNLRNSPSIRPAHRCSESRIRPRGLRTRLGTYYRSPQVRCPSRTLTASPRTCWRPGRRTTRPSRRRSTRCASSSPARPTSARPTPRSWPRRASPPRRGTLSGRARFKAGKCVCCAVVLCEHLFLLSCGLWLLISWS